MDAVTRVAETSDIDTIFHIRTSVREIHLSRSQLTEMGITPESIAQALAHAPCAWITEVNGDPVGFSMVDIDEGCVFAAFVLPAFEGCGVGRALMREAETMLFQHHRTIWLETAGESRASGFYERLGWRAVEALPGGDVRFEKHGD